MPEVHPLHRAAGRFQRSVGLRAFFAFTLLFDTLVPLTTSTLGTGLGQILPFLMAQMALRLDQRLQ